LKRLTLILPIIIILLNAANLTAQENAKVYFDQGMNQYRAGEFDMAIKSFESAKRLQPYNAEIWQQLGNVYFSLGDYDTAIENYNRAIQLNIEYDMEDPEVYAKRAEAYNNKGNYNSAEADYSHAIRLDEENAKWWNNRGEIYRNKDDYDRAVEHFSKAIDINKNYTEAMNNLGRAYYDNGDYNMAIEYFNKAIDIDRYYAQAWNNRGSAWLEIGNYNMAIADFTQLLKFNANYEYAIIYSNRSRAYRMKKQYWRALRDCNAALRIDRNYAPALNNRAQTYLEMGSYRRALAAYKECLDAAEKSININDISVYAWFLAGQVYEKYPYLKGNIKRHTFWSKFAGLLALDGINRGVKNAENIRQNMGTHGADLMAQMIYLYYAGVDFEAVLGSAENVFFYSESLRSRGFLEQVGAEAAIRLAGVTEEERKKFMLLRANIEEQQAVINTYDRTKLEGEANNRYTLAIRQRKDAEEALAELDREIGRRIPKYNELRNPRPATLNQAKAYCGDDRAVLEYVLWDASAYKPIKGIESWNLKGAPPTVNSYCLVITKNGLTAVPLDSGFNYHDAIQKLREGFLASATNASLYEKPRNDLYDYLIKPVLPYLQNIKNITIVPDGELAMIPFDILRTDNYSKDFGESYVISLSPSISVSILTQKEESWTQSPILFFANDEYLGKIYSDGKEWDDLPGVKEEIERIKKIADEQNKESFSYFRERATKENIKLLSENAELRNYPIIHFACHGYFNREKPTESGLVLYQVSGDPVNGSNSYLTIPEVAALELNARMVVLSACETGLVEAKLGEGMVGLIRAFMVAGASNVGVSLWVISDEATSPFMESLYQKVLGEGKHFRESYKEVKESFRKWPESLFRRPYFWAAFTMYE
jgi:CHAT domain-containing protein/Tfp pilus assembly protein PilF